MYTFLTDPCTTDGMRLATLFERKDSPGRRTMSLFLYRLIGAAMLDAGMYEGIEADRHVTIQAMATVLL